MSAKLADYRLDRRIGSGASGEVYEAALRDGGNPVAIKLIFPHLSESEDNLARFERQCRLLSTIDHPGVVPVHHWGFCEERRQLFLEMPLLRGCTLGEYMRESESTLQLVELLDMALQGLAAAHLKGLVHRDVKPDNIFVVNGDRPEARVIDFGLVRQVDATGPTATQMGLGTPSYMAPEQATSARSVSVAADVWSSGVVLYRIVSGRLPFTGEGPYETMIRVVSMPPPPLPGVPEPIQALIFACLDKDPAQRPPDAAAVRTRLASALAAPGVRDWLRAKPWHGSREFAAEPLDTTFIRDATQAGTEAVPVSMAGPTPTPPPDSEAGPRRGWSWAAVLVLMLALGLGIGPLWWPPRDDVQPLDAAEDSVATETQAAPLPEPLPPLEPAPTDPSPASPEDSDDPNEGTGPDPDPAAAKKAVQKKTTSPRSNEAKRAAAKVRRSEPRSTRPAETEPATTKAEATEAEDAKRKTTSAAESTPPESAEPPKKPTEKTVAEKPATTPPKEEKKEPEVDPRDILTF